MFDVGGDTLLVVDDADHATQRQSADLRDRALTRPVLVGVRIGTATPELEWLWRSGAIERFDLAPLEPAEAVALVEARVGSPVHRAFAEVVALRSGGRPGFIVDFIDSLRVEGQLLASGGLVRAASGAAVGARLVERARELMATLPLDTAADLALMAVAGCLPVGALSNLDVDLPELERRGLAVRHTGDRAGQVVRLDPPMLSGAVRAAIAPAKALDLARTVIDKVRSVLEPADAVRLATELGDPIELGDLTAAARQAVRRDEPSVALALTTEVGHYGPAGLALQAEVLVEAGRRFEAGDRYAQVLQDDAADPMVWANVAVEYSLLLLWDLGRPDEAMQVAALLAQAASDSPLAVVAVAHLAAVSMYAGRPEAALEMLDGLDEAQLDPAMSSATTMVRVTSRSLTTPDLVTGIDDVSELVAFVGTDRSEPFEPAVLVISAVLALELAGRVNDAGVVLADCRQRLVGRWTPAAVGWLALADARVQLAVGRPEAARRAAVEAWNAFADVNHPSGIRWAAAAALFADALSGDSAGCRSGIESFGELEPGVPFLDADLLRARAWAHWAAGNGSVAAALFRDAVELARSSGAVALEALALHDSFRVFGHPVRSRLAELAGASPAPSIVLRSRHLDCVAAADHAGLLVLSAEFEHHGMLLLAAEVAGDVARLATAGGLRSSARIAQGRRAQMIELCGAASTPSLADHRAVALTSRERDVAVLAANGMASRDIADRLDVSVRTVDNLLQRVYVKLGVRGRSELADRIV